MKRKFVEIFIIFLKGLFMGGADIIPGVSGGTIALITGIYERLVKAIRSIDFRFIPYFFKGFYDSKFFEKSKKNFFSIDFSLLIPLVLGISFAFLSLANLLDFLLVYYETYTYAFFLGLILASAFFVYFSVKKEFTLKSLFFVFLGSIFGFLIVGIESFSASHSLLIIFAVGFISFCAMILPGVSGAFILLIFGQYDFMIGVLKKIAAFDFSSVIYAIIYVLGGLIGLLSFSRFLSYLLKKYHTVTLCFIIGLMIGALRSPAEIILAEAGNIYITFSSILFGIILVSVLSFFRHRLT
ncbi:MAG: DUF368 domain-containing protein [Candidatus Thermoplasmatota archaeon]